MLGGRKGQNAVVLCSLIGQSPKPPIEKKKRKEKRCKLAEIEIVSFRAKET
jgi:hypothetical protein